jgi:hypothetical protein
MDVVVDFLAERGWPYEKVDGRSVVTFPFVGDSEQWQVFVETRDRFDQVVVYSVCPFNIPAEERLAAAEYVTRANYGLIIGNFEMDMGDGEVRFKTSIDVEGSALDRALVNQLVIGNVRAMNQYVAGLGAIVEGSRTPKELVADAEGGPARS